MPPGLARLDALHGRHAADRGGLPAAPLAEAAPHEHDRHRPRPIVRAAASWPAAGGPRPPATTSPGGRADRSAAHAASRWRHARSQLYRLQEQLRDSDGTTRNAAHSRPACLGSRSPAPAGLLGMGCALLGLWSAPAAAQRIENSVAIFAALDKVTAKISRLEVPLNQTRQVRRPQDHAARLLHARAHRAAQDHHLRGGRRGDARRQGKAHLLGLDVRRQPRPQRRRASGVRRLADRVHGARRARAAPEGGRPAASAIARRQRPAGRQRAAAADRVEPRRRRPPR